MHRGNKLYENQSLRYKRSLRALQHNGTSWTIPTMEIIWRHSSKQWPLTTAVWVGRAIRCDSKQDEVRTHELNLTNLKWLQDLRNDIVQKLKKTHRRLAEQQSKLGELRRSKVRGEHSIETKIFKVLNKIGIELSSYHGGSLNGKDIKKVMSNGTHIFY